MSKRKITFDVHDFVGEEIKFKYSKSQLQVLDININHSFLNYLFTFETGI